MKTSLISDFLFVFRLGECDRPACGVHQADQESSPHGRLDADLCGREGFLVSTTADHSVRG